jgi:hypothetical protein
MPSDLDDLRLELVAPSGAPWVIGPPAAQQVIAGPAGEWARVAVQRLAPAAAPGLTAEGSLAEQALAVARAFA